MLVDFSKYKGISNANLNKIEVVKEDKLIRFVFVSNNAISLVEIDKAIDEIKERYSNMVNVEFCISYNIDIENDKNFYDTILINVQYLIRKVSLMCYKSSNISLENGSIIIKISNELAFAKLKEHSIDRKIKEYFLKLYNTELNISIMLDKNIVVNNNAEIINDEIMKSLSDGNISKKSADQPKAQTFTQKPFNRVKQNVRDEKKFGTLELSEISEINDNSGEVHIKGKVIACDRRELKSGSTLFIFSVTDFLDTINVKYFCRKNMTPEQIDEMANYKAVEVIGNAEFDSFSKELVVMSRAIKESEFKVAKRIDNAEVKRVELHLHTCMSSMDGISPFADYAKLAKSWGHKALAITDHGVVQGYPNAMDTASDDFKVIYGMEGYLVNDGISISYKCQDKTLDSELVVFDIETTGFNARKDHIIEIGAVRIKNRQIVDNFNTLISTNMKLPDKIIELTSITDEMLVGQPTIEDALNSFKEFVGNDAILVAHNANFDVKFIKEKFRSRFNEVYDMPVIDTLELSKALVKGIRNYKLNTLTKKFNIILENHHRAVDDAKATAFLLLELYKILEEKEITSFSILDDTLKDSIDMNKKMSYHINILVKNYEGLKSLYELVSDSHINHFYKKPRILKSDLNKVRKGLIIGTACEAGELYKAILEGESDEKIENIAEFYDFLEIQPLENNAFLVRNGRVKDFEELKDINRKIIALARKLNKLVIATGDVHFLNKEDELYRKILMTGQGFEDAEDQAPLYLMTTDEMLERFSYLGQDLAYEVVVTNTNVIADSIENILPIPNGTFPPIIDGADDEFRTICFERAHRIYGDVLPEIVESRLNRELNSIISNGYAIMYIIAEKLVKKSNEDGYIVGSRGSVGSSFAATMSGISEVNPLVPHYICDHCTYSEFITDGSYGSGVDMPDKDCPKCGKKLRKDGHDIPFEVFLGFEGDKEPDIDLNFAGEEQGVAMKYTEELFGVGKVFRAGTIGTIADKTAYGFVKNYFEDKHIPKRNAEINRIIQGCVGIKRTSGQHPGGVMVVPRNKDIHDFTPIQYPANNSKSGSITTHFDYHSISGRILKLDLLGHDTPSIIRMLEDFTGINDKDVPLDDAETMSIFTSPKALNVTKNDINCETGTLAIPEFGTAFVRKMVLETQPKTFSDLLRISGLSHGTDVWVGNAQDLILNNTCVIKEVIATRDDIMTYLIHKGVAKKLSFVIMERVRKGRGLRDSDIEAMNEQNVPQWYIDSCQKIKYMFPKAHAVAYVMMSVKIAYFKVHYPEAFYASYFTMKAQDFNAEVISNGEDAIKQAMKEIEDKGNEKTTKEKDMYTVLEVANEMYKRGFKCEKVDLYKSDDKKFKVVQGGILPPLVGLQGLGENAAISIKNEREKGEFISVEDIVKRARVTKTVIEVLDKHGCLQNLDKTNQISIFNF
ncbi:PolC-type DNA polymerase III [Sedimentibacter sp. zth1]|uniref:PolC-type DNA polymerase III n=1 Tax=Sedimentibacter sp. zth1 TaxID=2816908 RepID=UPI001A933394|nr:PolC-type DNA polymerase III [Sedimentibacter sp. zth1]QSX06550.1 PolC-type DNA polymerase III [Sedimentibacter sp. zth1]